MITCEHDTSRLYSCDNCDRITPIILKYKFIDIGKHDKKYTFATLCLCEDCSNAISTLHSNVMEEGKPFKYEEDDFKELEEI